MIKWEWVAGRSVLNVLGVAYLDGGNPLVRFLVGVGCAAIVHLYSGICSAWMYCRIRFDEIIPPPHAPISWVSEVRRVVFGSFYANFTLISRLSLI